MVKKIIKWLIDNYFFSIFLASIAFVGIVSVYKLFFVKPTFVYAKVKVGQGLWWASTQKPSFWFVKSFENLKKEEEKDLTGQPLAQVISIRYYPYWGSNQYDVYLTMKLKVSKMGKMGKYNFKRSAIGVGSPVDFEFPSAQFSGTIIALSEKPFKEKYETKTIIVTKKAANPWEYDSIGIGDYYFDGIQKAAEIVDKSAKDTQTLTSDVFGNYPDIALEQKKYLFVKIKLKVKNIDDKLIFGEEQVIAPGRTINLATNNFQFNDFVIAQIKN